MSNLGCTEQLWFKILVLVVGFLVVGFSIANAIFYGQIWSDGGCGSAVTVDQARIMTWLNIALAILGGILVIFGIWRFIKYETRQRYIDQASDKLVSTNDQKKPTTDVATSTSVSADVLSPNAMTQVSAATPLA